MEEVVVAAMVEVVAVAVVEVCVEAVVEVCGGGVGALTFSYAFCSTPSVTSTTTRPACFRPVRPKRWIERVAEEEGRREVSGKWWMERRWWEWQPVT